MTHDTPAPPTTCAVAFVSFDYWAWLTTTLSETQRQAIGAELHRVITGPRWGVVSFRVENGEVRWFDFTGSLDLRQIK